MNKILLSLFLCLVFILPAYAIHAELLPAATLFEQMDTDKDGFINRSEINKQSLLANEFDSVDKNKDGNLDSGEFEFFIALVDL